jgi:hypothetical protein
MRKLLLLLLLTGCKNDAVTSANITIPVDTLDIFTTGDTVFVFDTLVIVDTIPTQLVYDSVVFPLEGYIGDASTGMDVLDLGNYHLPTYAQVWVMIELSHNSQKDEAWGLVQEMISERRDIPTLDCPLVPDYPWLGTDWVFVGFAEPGEFSLEARHASLYDCYDPVDYFKTANSVHFKQVKFVWADTKL